MSRPDPDADPPVLSVVIPAYNEEARIGPSLRRVCDFLEREVPHSEILVVDDGSTDGTIAQVEANRSGRVPVRVLPLRPNRGKGEAVRSGMMAAAGTYILMSDADLSAPIEELQLLLDPVRKGDYDIAIGSRGLPESRLGIRQPWMRERMGRIFNVFVRAITGLTIRDTQCGFKLFSRPAARSIFPRQQGGGFAFDAEVLFIAHRTGLRILEQPITWNNVEGSKVNPLLDSLRMFWDLIRIRVWDLRGTYRQALAEES